MNLSDNFIRRPVMTIMLNAAMVVFGIIGLLRLPVRELPDVDPSVVNVLTVYPGASAAVVEREVTDRMEEALSSAEGVTLLTSTSREQASSVQVEFTQGRDVEVCAQDVRDLVARIRGKLPADIDEPIVSKQDANARAIIWVAFYSDRYNTEELTQIAENQVKDQLQTVPGVSSIIIGGEKKFAIRLWLDSDLMTASGVTVLDVQRALQEKNVELPSGRVENLSRELTIETLGQLKSADQFNALIIRQDGNRVIRLKDIGRAEDGVEDERSVARFDSRPAIGLGIVRQSKANTLAVAEGIKAKMAEIAPDLPKGIEFRYPYDESIFVSKAVHEVWGTLALSVVLVVLTIFIFLRNVRATILPALAIPISVLTTFGIIYLCGFSINIFTLLSLVLAIGIVVDDSIIVLENIYRHIEDGMAPMAAAFEAMKEISFAVVATTLSLVAVFLPVAFIGGVTGRLLLEFVVALAVSVVVSAVVALTLSPMAGARVLKPIDSLKHGKLFLYFERKLENLTRRYERTLTWSLNHRPTILMLTLATVGAAIFFYCKLEKEFLPDEDKGRLFCFVITPEGSTPDYTDRMLHNMEGIVKDVPEVDGYFSAVALPMDGPGSASQGIMFLRLKEGKRRHVRDILFGGPDGLFFRCMTEVEGAIAIPIMPKSVETGFNQPFRLVIRNPDLTELDSYVTQLKGKLMQAGFLANVRSGFELTKPELRINIDRDRAGELGVSIQDIAQTIQVLFGGQHLSDVKVNGRQYEVVVQLNREDRLTPTDLNRLYVRNLRGELVRLDSVVTTETGSGPNSIERFNRERSATIEGTPTGVTLGTAMEKAKAMVESSMPPGFSYDWLGDARNLRESSHDIYGFMLLAILVVYMVLAAQFESFLHPITVMCAMLLSLVGAFGLLYVLSMINGVGSAMYGWLHFDPHAPWFAHVLAAIFPRIPSMTINIFSEVGLMLLIGMVTKNAILLVEFANQLMDKGMDARSAILKAGIIRLRPILMTSLATVAGILPIAMGFGEASESRRPLGVVAVGGLITSTLLTLVVIPVIYTFMAGFTERKKHTTPSPAQSGSALTEDSK